MANASRSRATLPGFDGSEPPEVVERYLTEVRRVSPADRFRYCALLSGDVLRMSFEGFRTANHHLSPHQLMVEFARATWGDDVADLYVAALNP